MRNKIVLAAVGGAVLTAVLAPHANAQDAQSTSTTETTTTTQQIAPPPPPPPMSETTTRTETTTVDHNAMMPGYESFGYRADNLAAHNGYNDGYDKGLSDMRQGHSYHPQDTHLYNHPTGFPGGPNKGEYDRVYKEAFVHGYERGYRSTRP